jgi:hypothetical protein
MSAIDATEYFLEMPADSRVARKRRLFSFGKVCQEKSRLIRLFQEMSVPLTPLTAIAQTPRKEQESKFSFNPHLAKV